VKNSGEIMPLKKAAELQGTPAAEIPQEVIARTRDIVADVAGGGDAALRRHAGELDGLGPDEPLVLHRSEMESALASLSSEVQSLLARTAERIGRFAAAQRKSLPDLDLDLPGGRAGHRVMPLEVAGCYAPGGRYPLPSSVLMTAVTARAARVPTVVVASPRPCALMVGAAAVAGADFFLTAGGAQAIAALAHGTESLPACQAVVGPGNIWVTAAKQLVSHLVRTDGAAGPSELVVVADDTSDATTVAADLLAQAEHDTLARTVLVALEAGIIPRVRSELARQLASLPTAETARPALQGGCMVPVDSVSAAVELCNRLAPEHLQWSAAGKAPAELRNYGSLFSGPLAAEVLGDYGAGPNHTLPTGGAARLRGGLWVGDFLATRTYLHLEDRKEMEQMTRDAEDLARLEGLAGHALAARQRRAGKG
jgi:phosphoribosyl-ATP pyrophosphohydrolase/phosphoribosyl-AMP cyclohydrolase/histidinol dehydrogenase